MTVGMDISNYISNKMGMISDNMYLKMKQLLIMNWPDYSFGKLDIDRLCDSLIKDKKNKGKKLGAILTGGPGKMKKVFLDMRQVKLNLRSYLKFAGMD
jgi:3-dehydroquinate synthetase